jgi:hypothetical protein
VCFNNMSTLSRNRMFFSAYAVADAETLMRNYQILLHTLEEAFFVGYGKGFLFPDNHAYCNVSCYRFQLSSEGPSSKTKLCLIYRIIKNKFHRFSYDAKRIKHYRSSRDQRSTAISKFSSPEDVLRVDHSYGEGSKTPSI